MIEKEYTSDDIEYSTAWKSGAIIFIIISIVYGIYTGFEEVGIWLFLALVACPLLYLLSPYLRQEKLPKYHQLYIRLTKKGIAFPIEGDEKLATVPYQAIQEIYISDDEKGRFFKGDTPAKKYFRVILFEDFTKEAQTINRKITRSKQEPVYEPLLNEFPVIVGELMPKRQMKKIIDEIYHNIEMSDEKY